MHNCALARATILWLRHRALRSLLCPLPRLDSDFNSLIELLATRPVQWPARGSLSYTRLATGKGHQKRERERGRGRRKECKCQGKCHGANRLMNRTVIVPLSLSLISQRMAFTASLDIDRGECQAIIRPSSTDRPSEIANLNIPLFQLINTIKRGQHSVIIVRCPRVHGDAYTNTTNTASSTDKSRQQTTRAAAGSGARATRRAHVP